MTFTTKRNLILKMFQDGWRLTEICRSIGFEEKEIQELLEGFKLK